MDEDLEVGIERLSDAIRQLQAEDTVENREMVCIETRAVFAIFEDESHWQGKEDPLAKRELIKLFAEAESLMAKHADVLHSAVKKRLDELRTHNFSQAKALTAI